MGIVQHYFYTMHVRSPRIAVQAICALAKLSIVHRAQMTQISFSTLAANRVAVLFAVGVGVVQWCVVLCGAAVLRCAVLCCAVLCEVVLLWCDALLARRAVLWAGTHTVPPSAQELEKKYKDGLHVVEKVGGVDTDLEQTRRTQVNLNLMVEVQYQRRTPTDPWVIAGVRKVVRMPDHVSVMDNLAEASHLLREIRSSNCLLFLGAGFSFPAKLPGWSKLLVTAAELAENFVSNKPNKKPFRVSRDAQVL